MPQNRDVWCVIPAFDRSVLEKRVGGSSLLEIAIRSADMGKNPKFRYVMVATDDETIAGQARRLGACLPRRLIMPAPEDSSDHRGSSFHAVDFFVQESETRIYRWGSPHRFVSINPFFPCQFFNTTEDVYRGCEKNTMAVPVLDVYPGLVRPVWSVFGHIYSPVGLRPHENYEAFVHWNKGRQFSIDMVRISSVSEAADCHSDRVLEFLNCLSKNRSFRLDIAVGADECYVPVSNKCATPSWGAYIPVDANFVYDAGRDRRLYNGDRHGHTERPRVLQQAATQKARHGRTRTSALRLD